MAIACDTESLIEAARCFLCLSEKETLACELAVECANINGETLDCDANTLVDVATAAGYMNMSEKQLRGTLLWVRCNGGGGGGGGSGQIKYYISNPNSDGVVPDDTSKPAIAIKEDGTLPTFNWNVDLQLWN